jgi:L-alanine-DL-glutamate epimerase-like enolase superfamily enzyme
MTCSVIAIAAEHRGRRVVGFGYTSNGRYAQSGLLRERFIPRFLAAGSGGLDPRRVRDVVMVNEKPGGHGERSVAVGGLEMAAWDLAAKIAGEPGYRFIAAAYGRPEPPDRVTVYAAGGYYEPSSSLAELREEIRRFVDLGYPLVKMKIGGAPLDRDVERIAAAVDEARPAAVVAVDANGRLTVEVAIAYGQALAGFGVRWFEEPVDPLDFGGLAAVAREVRDVPVATGENLFSMQDARNLMRFGGLDRDTAILQMDPVLSYGVEEYRDVLDAAAAEGWSEGRFIPHGGHHLAVAVAAAFGLGGAEVYPTKFQPFGIATPTMRVENGSLPLPDVPGLGLELRPDLSVILRTLEARLTG